MDVNTKFDIFYDQISQFINYHVPRRKLSKREFKLSTKPWITKHILANIRYRDKKLYSKSLRINIQMQIFFNVGKNIDKDIPHGNFCPTSFLRGNFLDSIEVHSYISQMDNDQIH